MQNKKEAKRDLPHSSFFPKNSRGQGLSTNAIILIVLGVFILVILILGFTMGWNTLKDRIGVGGDNVDVIANACSAACSTQSNYDFCSKQRELKVSDLPDGVKSVTNTCSFFADAENDADYGKYGIEECPGLCS